MKNFELKPIVHDDEGNRENHSGISKRNTGEISASIEDSYAGSFTIHGLSKVFTGNPLEKFGWAVALLMGIALATYVILNNVRKYNNRDVYVDIKQEVVKHQKFPALTICTRRNQWNLFCGKEVYQMLQRKTCPRSVYSPAILKGIFGTYSVKKWQFNIGTFTFRKVGDDARIVNHSLAQCVTIFPGKRSEKRNQLEFEFTAKSLKAVQVFIHNPNEFAILKQPLKLFVRNSYDIILKKTQYLRLPAPYPSNCFSGKSNNMFPGLYTMEGCKRTIICRRAMEKCGRPYDYCLDFLDGNFVKNQAKNLTFTEMHNCLRINEEDFDEYDSCQVPCNETVYDTSVLTTNHIDRSDKTQIAVSYQNPSLYTQITEKEQYTWYELLSEAGGFIGLMIGMSVLSLVELFVYVILIMIKKCFTKP